MLRLPTVAHSTRDLTRALPGVQDEAQLAQFSDSSGDPVNGPTHIHRELHVRYVREVAEPIKDFLLPISKVLSE